MRNSTVREKDLPVTGALTIDHQGLFSCVFWDFAMPVNEKNSVLLSNKCDDPEEI